MMLIYQALKAEECWLGREIEEENVGNYSMHRNQLQKYIPYRYARVQVKMIGKILF